MQALLHQEYLQQKKKTADWIAKAKQEASAKAIHQMRKEIKKLRAFYQLFALLTSDHFSAKAAYKPIKKIYKPAGKARDRQLNLVAIEKHDIALDKISGFSNYLKAKEKKYTAKLTKQLGKWKPGKLDKPDETTKAICDETDDRTLLISSARHFLVEIERIKNLHATKEVNDNVHEIRKILKAQYYIYSLVNKIIQKEALAEWLKTFKATQSKIGDWHDKIGMISLVKKQLSKNDQLPEEEKNQLEELSKQLETEADRLFKAADKKLLSITDHHFAEDFKVAAI